MFIVAEKDEGRILTIGLERPPANALDDAAVAALDAILDRIEASDTVRAVLFHARGRFFSAGADIRAMGETMGRPDAAERLTGLARTMQSMFDRIEALPVPTVCALSGIATGGGFELALACDIRIAEPEARVGLPEGRIGLLPGAGGTQRLTRIAGTSVARRLILTGELISGTRAAELGLLHDLAAPGEAYAAALALCATLAGIPKRTQAALKKCLMLAPSEAGFAMEIDETLALHNTAETQALLRGFLERR